MKKPLIILIQLGLITSLNFSSCKNKSDIMSQEKIITKYDTLLKFEGKEVNVCGTYVKYNHLPHLTRSDIEYLSGLLLDGDSVPKLFIEGPRSVEEQDNLNGKKVQLSGIFYTVQPLEEGENPLYTARIKGSWIYNVSAIKLVE